MQAATADEQTKFEMGDVLTPLIITDVNPEPSPVPGTDGRRHLAYELAVFNAGPRPATLHRIRARAESPDGPVLGELAGDQIVVNSLLVGEYAATPQPVQEIPHGRTVVVILDLALADEAPVPSRLVHEVDGAFGPPGPGQGDPANLFPAEIRQLGGVVRVGNVQPVELAPPLIGTNWFAGNGCGQMNSHRGAVMPVGGRLNAAERYAIDWVQIDPDRRPLVDEATGLLATFDGPSDDNTSYYCWDAPILAVADGEIVVAVDDMVDAVPQVMTKGIPFEQLGGNRLVLKIADDVYAFYAHLKPGSIAVSVGDRVTVGQELARLGNSGNTSEAHLHFHVMDSEFPLDADNLPFVIKEFHYDGEFTPDGVLGSAGPRRDQLPFVNSVIGFGR